LLLARENPSKITNLINYVDQIVGRNGFGRKLFITDFNADSMSILLDELK